jgi:hypothetical protein
LAEKGKTISPYVTQIDPFKLLEFMGWAWGLNMWASFTLPAGMTLVLRSTVPPTEVWWYTFGILAGMPSNTVIVQFDILPREHHDPLLLHDGWVGQPLCPPGWHRATGGQPLIMTIQNVTGDPRYNPFPAQDLHVDMTLFIFRSWQRFVEKIEKFIQALTGEEVIW